MVWCVLDTLICRVNSSIGDLIPSHGHEGGLEVWCKQEGATWTPPESGTPGICLVSGNASLGDGEILYVGGVIEVLNNPGTISNSGVIVIDSSGVFNNWSDGDILNFGNISINPGNPDAHFNNQGTTYNYGEIFISGWLNNHGTIYNLCEGYIAAGVGTISGDGNIYNLDECGYIPMVVK